MYVYIFSHCRSEKLEDVQENIRPKFEGKPCDLLLPSIDRPANFAKNILFSIFYNKT